MKTPPYIARIISERDQLRTRMALLDNFIETRKFNEKPETEKKLIKQQRAHMYLYLDILQKRIAYYIDNG